MILIIRIPKEGIPNFRKLLIDKASLHPPRSAAAVTDPRLAGHGLAAAVRAGSTASVVSSLESRRSRIPLRKSCHHPCQSHYDLDNSATVRPSTPVFPDYFRNCYCEDDPIHHNEGKKSHLPHRLDRFTSPIRAPL